MKTNSKYNLEKLFAIEKSVNENPKRSTIVNANIEILLKSKRSLFLFRKKNQKD